MALIAAAAVGALIGGCGATNHATPPAAHEGSLAGAALAIPIASCAPEPLAHAPFPQEVGVYRAGPLILAVGQDLAQQPQEWPGRRTSGSEAIAVLRGHSPVLVSVDPSSRRRFSLQFTPYGRGHRAPVLSDGRPAVRFPVCAGRLHRFGGAILVRGRGCARLRVTQPGRAPVPMLIVIGDTLDGCPKPGPLAPLGSTALPFLGIACRKPNSIACDRVGVGVHLTRVATLVVVQIAGRLVTLSPPTDAAPDDLWLGYLFDAGLRHGPLDVHIPPRVDRWLGDPGVYPRVRVIAFFPDGRAGSLGARVMLHAGFG